MPVTLTPNECRVLGTLIEKAMTVPAQYPLTLNSLGSGCSQRNNRDPVVELDEEAILDAIDGLRAKGLVREVSMEGSRVAKYRHVAREALAVGAAELAVLAELLLRGPQTQGELRGRASRMHPLESMEVLLAVLESLLNREAPLIERLDPAPGSRAERYAQLLCPTLHPEPVAVQSFSKGNHAAVTAARSSDGLADRVTSLEAVIGELRARLDRLERELGA